MSNQITRYQWPRSRPWKWSSRSGWRFEPQAVDQLPLVDPQLVGPTPGAGGSLGRSQAAPAPPVPPLRLFSQPGARASSAAPATPVKVLRQADEQGHGTWWFFIGLKMVKNGINGGAYKIL